MPPLRRGIPLHEYRLDLEERTVRFRHDGPELEVTLEQRDSAQGRGQLSLPVEPA